MFKLLHPLDLSAGLSYIAAGGLASVAAALSVISPGHSALWTSGGIALAAIAGFIRIIGNPTPPQGTLAVVSTEAPPTPESLKTVPKP